MGTALASVKMAGTSTVVLNPAAVRPPGRIGPRDAAAARMGAARSAGTLNNGLARAQRQPSVVTSRNATHHPRRGRGTRPAIDAVAGSTSDRGAGEGGSWAGKTEVSDRVQARVAAAASCSRQRPQTPRRAHTMRADAGVRATEGGRDNH